MTKYDITAGVAFLLFLACSYGAYKWVFSSAREVIEAAPDEDTCYDITPLPHLRTGDEPVRHLRLVPPIDLTPVGYDEKVGLYTTVDPAPPSRLYDQAIDGYI